jgi:hypothetical protein
MRSRLQLAVLLLLVLATAAASYRALGRWRGFRSAESTCAAVQAGDWDAALRASRGRLEPSVSGLATADCRCVALVESRQRAECERLLAGLLSDPRSGDWLPRPPLTLLMVAARQEEGRMSAALQLAQRGADRYPTFYPLLLLETSLRLRLHEPGAALDAMAARIAKAGVEAPRLRMLLATEALSRGDYERALSLAGEQPPSGDQESQWYEARATALARLGRRRQLMTLVDRWAKSNRALAHGVYGWLLSTTQQTDPLGRGTSELMREAVDAGAELHDDDLLKRIWLRYVGNLAINGRTDEALRSYDAAVARFGDAGHLDRADLARTASPAGAGEMDARAATGRIELRVRQPAPGMALLVSPPAAEPHDRPYERLAVPAGGLVTLARPVETWPVHWVLRAGDGSVRGSGVVWPESEGVARAAITPRAPVSVLAPAPLDQRPATARRRLFVVILDCADWRFVRHGIARGELPAFEALASRGQRAVVSSVPAFTAIAIRTLANPGAHGVDGVVGVLHQLGEEAAGLNFIGRNPLASLALLMPDAANLFATLGAGDLRAVNLLHSTGGLQVGHNGELTGPRGAVSSVPLLPARELRPAERAVLGDLGRSGALLEEMASDFDNVVRLAAPAGPELVVIRVASLDLLTHLAYPEVVRAGQDDGNALLYRVYRYVDRRLAELYRALDGNDVLVVMSDHGIRTALEHDPQALFIVAGAGVPVGRVPGQPELRGVPRMIADFFGTSTNWPASGLEWWVGAPAAPPHGTAPTAGSAP